MIKYRVIDHPKKPHYCPNWDFLFISPGDKEFDDCGCFTELKEVSHDT